jgi:ubiquinone/menaquinone biosynthesis C-methylase UbiE
MEWLSFAPITAWTVLEGSSFTHRHLNRNTGFSKNYSFEDILDEKGPIDTHVDLGTGPRSPVAETVLEELEVRRSIGVDRINYMHEASGCGHTYENPVYGEKEGEFVKAEGTELPLEDDSTDLITMGRYLNNIEPDRRDEALDEVQRVLRPGGKAIGDIKVTRFLRPHQMLHEKTLGTQEVIGRAARGRYREMWEEKLNDYFEEVETEAAWIDDEERPYVQAIRFSAENPQNY